MKDKTPVTVVIPTYNRCNDLKRCLDSLMQQTYKDFEILVIDNKSTDDTQNLLKNYPVKVLRNGTKNVMHLFNLGWQKSQSEIIVYTNDDTKAEPFWIESIVKTFQECEEAGAVGGPTMPPKDMMNNLEMLSLHEKAKHSKLLKIPVFIYEKIILENKYYDIGVLCESGAFSVGGALIESTKIDHIIEVDFLTITNLGIKRSVLKKLGGIDENFRFNHGDGDLFIRMKKAGYKLLFNPKVIVWHYVNPQGPVRGAYWRGRDYAYFYLKSIRPNIKSMSSLFRFLLNIIYFNVYWIFKLIQEKKLEYLYGITGFIQGCWQYRKTKIKEGEEEYAK